MFSLILFLISVSALHGQYYGLKFSGIEVPPNQRTGFHIIDEQAIKTKDGFDLQFFLRLKPDPEFKVRKIHKANYGYIFRMVIGQQQIDMVHGSLSRSPNNIELITGNQSEHIAFAIPQEELWNDWVKVRLELDFVQGLLSFHVDDRSYTQEITGLELTNGFRLMFGANDYDKYVSTDVPGMILRDVELGYNKNTWHWPLDETEGNTAHSIPSGKNALTINPGWLLKDHNLWKPLLIRNIPGQVKTAFDTKHDELYLFSEDSVYIYTFQNDSIRVLAQNGPSPIKYPNHLIYDSLNNQLLVYSLMDEYLAAFNLETLMWSSFVSGNERLTDHWHHNRIITQEGDLLVFGGYGHHTYLNLVQKWEPDSARFIHLDYQGEFQPRYLAASSYNPRDSLVYILGGYGSKTGRQSMSPDYYYELLSYSTNDRTFSRVAEFENNLENFCFSNKAFIDNKNELYALRYSKHLFDNSLQLIRIPLEDPEIQETGNPLDYTFLDVSSYADLHYSKSTNTLVSLTTYTSEGLSELAIRSIAFPPQPYMEQPAAQVETTNRYWLVLGASLILLAIVMLLYFRQRKRGRSSEKSDSTVVPTLDKNKNSIILFGGFQIFDQSGQDITVQFSPLPKKLLLHVLLHSIRDDKGVSDNTLYEIFWFGKTVENARNNRSVNVIKLKSILENLDSVNLSKDTGYLKLHFDPTKVNIDYYEFLQIVRQKSDLKKEQIESLLSIMDNKLFLKNTHEEWLDPFKSEVSNDAIDVLLKYIDNSDDDPDFLLHLTNCIFLCDSVSEEALKIHCSLLVKQGKLSLAKKSYNRFVNEYKTLYDDTYEVSFKELID